MLKAGRSAFLAMPSLAALTVWLVWAESIGVLESPGPKNPWPVARLVTLPASRSAWVAVAVAVQVVVAPAARLRAALAHSTVAILLSVIVNGPLRVTLPVLVRV